MLQQVEHLDRGHWNTVCVAEFQPVLKMSDVAPGDKIIVPASDRYGGLLDGKTMLPILLAVDRLIEPNHYKLKAVYHDGKEYGYGSIMCDLCLRMID
jgi:hypothetical protein